jgi:putative two-component system response regulator
MKPSALESTIMKPAELELAELEPAELEPIELEALEREEPSASPPGLAQRASRVARKSPLMGNIHIQGLIASYQVSPEPAGILDDNLAFIYRNQALKRLLKDFEYPAHASFIRLFGPVMEKEALQALYRDTKDAARGYGWKGTIRHRTHSAGSLVTKVHLMPFWANKTENTPPTAWIVLFDDTTNERKEFLRNMFSSLLQASKLKDNDTGKHIERVNLFSERLAQAMYGDERWPEIDFDFVEHIGFLAAMHDVGKIGTPDDILNKQGSLNEFEWNIMKEHTINGAFILSSYPDPMAKQIAQSHHERYDGSGYPYHLVGDMIPLPARIVAIADVYDALRMKRSYKAPFDHSRAALLIEADSGKHFDPVIVLVFRKIAKDFNKIYEANKD